MTEIINPIIITVRAVKRNALTFSLSIIKPSNALTGRLNCRNACTKLTLVTWIIAISTSK